MIIFFDGIQIFLWKFITESVNICNTQCLAEDIDSSKVVMRVKFKLTAIVVNLYVYFTVQNVNTTFSQAGASLNSGKNAPA